MLTIDLETARHFILGRHGLWPGRRCRGLKGTEKAMQAMEYLQLDPLQIIARSQDITLHSRVLDYKPEQWQDLPHWRLVMQRDREDNPRLDTIARDHADAIAEMRAVLQERGVVSNRDFDMSTRTRTQSYRGRKDSALALYYLWHTGEAMTHHRERFERVYAPTEQVAPAHLIWESSEEETDRFLVLKEVAFSSLSRISRTSDSFRRGQPDRAAKKLLASMLADGDLIEVKVEGWKQMHYALGSDVKLLRDLTTGRIPKAWEPLETTTTEETVFLAPVDPVIARVRAKELFGFEYIWEVYKPGHQRKFGYYTLPVLWGDRLVARFDSKLDRTTNTFVILGFWLEDKTLAKDGVFAEALTRGFSRFVVFLGAEKMDVKAISEPLLRRHAHRFIPKAS